MKNKHGFVGVAALVLGASFATSALARCSVHSGSPAVDTSMLQVKPTSMDVAVDAGHRMVTTLGTITNPSGNCFQNIVLELQYFDATKNHIDTVVEPMEGLVVPAGETVEFRVREPASRDAAVYVTQSVRLVDADVRWAKSPAKEGNAFVDLVLSWAPMLLLIAIWIYAMRRYSGKKSPQAKLIANSDLQIQATQELTAAVQRIAHALENAQVGRTPS